MNRVLLIDFGSTFTKVTAVDIEKECILGTATSFTTINTDINEGLNKAIDSLEKKYGKINYDRVLACSSAAGGLRMVVSGLVERVTVQAAKQACLGAGAKVIKVFSYEMTEEDILEIDEIKPEIFLLAGGTDGGDKKCILHNASMLSTCKSYFPIIIAGNKEVSYRCKNILSNKEVYIVDNVMPRYNELNIESAQNQIREIFLKRIVYAKGITKMKDLITGIIMPTPSAMMKAMEILAKGYKNEKGIGDILAIDMGGATTDVYSICDGLPVENNIINKGIKEPYVKRTVEGDIGMRYSVYGLCDVVGLESISEISNLKIEKVREIIDRLYLNPNTLPNDDDDIKHIDYALACKGVEVATIRHAGTREKIYTSNGIAYLQSGKDLRNVSTIIVTGGSIINSDNTDKIVKFALYNDNKAESLRPLKSRILIDRKYILSAMGLLSEYNPEIAIRIMKKELNYDGN